MDSTRKRSIAAYLAFLAFPATGWLSGYLAGISASPVVSALLPLVVGLLGVLSIGFVENKSLLKVVAKLAEKVGLENVDTSEIKSEHGEWAVAYWGLGIVAFCTTCWLGMEFGISRRVPTYAAPEVFFEKAGTKISDLSTGERAQLYAFRWRLMENGVSESEAISVFKDVISPALTDKQEIIRNSHSSPDLTPENIVDRRTASLSIILEPLDRVLKTGTRLFPEFAASPAHAAPPDYMPPEMAPLEPAPAPTAPAAPAPAP